MRINPGRIKGGGGSGSDKEADKSSAKDQAAADGDDQDQSADSPGIDIENNRLGEPMDTPDPGDQSTETDAGTPSRDVPPNLVDTTRSDQSVDSGSSESTTTDSRNNSTDAGSTTGDQPTTPNRPRQNQTERPGAPTKTTTDNTGGTVDRSESKDSPATPEITGGTPATAQEPRQRIRNADSRSEYRQATADFYSQEFGRDLSRDQIRLQESGDQFTARPRRSVIADVFSDSVPGELSADDITTQDGQFQLTEQAQAEIQQRQRGKELLGTGPNPGLPFQSFETTQRRQDIVQEAEQRAANQIEEQYSFDTPAGTIGPNIEPGEDVEARIDNGEVVVDTSGFENDFLASRFNQQTTADLDRGPDFTIDENQATSENVQQARAIADVASGFGLTVDQTLGIEAGDTTRNVELTPTGRREEIVAIAENEGELGGVEIKNAEEQIQFDEQGNIENIEQRAGGPVEGAIDFATDIGGAGSDAIGTVTSPIVDAGGAIEDRVVPDPVSDTAGDVVGGGINRGQQFAGGVADVSGGLRSGAERFVVDPSASAVGTGAEFLASPVAAARARANADSPGDILTPQTPIGEGVNEGLETAGRFVTSGTVGIADIDTLASRSETASSELQDNVVAPSAGVLGRGTDFTQQGLLSPGSTITTDQELINDVNPEAGLTDPQTEAGQNIERLATGAGSVATDFTVGLPATGIETGRRAGEAADFVGDQIAEEGVVEGSATSTAAGANAAAGTAIAFSRFAANNPYRTAGELAAGSAVGRFLSPIRLTRREVPLEEGRQTKLPRLQDTGSVELGDRITGTTQRELDVEGPSVGREQRDTSVLRGIRVEAPPIVRGLTQFRGRTVAGTRDGVPTTGTPTPRLAEVDFDEFAGRGATTEPVGRFETDILRGFADQAGRDARERFGVSERLAAQGARQDSELQTTSTEEIVRRAEDVPEGAAGPIADALVDLDATIFGSASVRAQVPDARQPRDVDIAVDDPDAAESRLSDALSGTDATVGDVFDIKAREDRATPGQIVKMGFTARERLETDEGVRVTPAGEELIKKSGASAFLRGESTPAADQPGNTGTVDVGPEPVAPGSFLRVKDPADASLIGAGMTDLSGTSRFSPLARRRARGLESDVTDFRNAFSEEIERSVADQPPTQAPGSVASGFANQLGINELLADDRGQAGLPGINTRRGSGASDDSDFEPLVTDDITAQVDLGSSSRADVDESSGRQTEERSDTVPAPLGVGESIVDSETTADLDASLRDQGGSPGGRDRFQSDSPQSDRGADRRETASPSPERDIEGFDLGIGSPATDQEQSDTQPSPGRSQPDRRESPVAVGGESRPSPAAESPDPSGESPLISPGLGGNVSPNANANLANAAATASYDFGFNITTPGGGSRGTQRSSGGARDRALERDEPRTDRGPSPTDPLAPGWLSETVGDIATQGLGVEEQISRDELESASTSEQLVGELPSAPFVASEESREAVSEVQDLFGLPGDDAGNNSDTTDEFFDFGLGFDGEDTNGGGAGFFGGGSDTTNEEDGLFGSGFF